LAGFEPGSVLCYLTKPIRKSQLYNALSGHIGTFELHRSEVGPQGEEIRKSDKARVLLAEDNPINQEFESLALKKLGCYVDVVSNGKEAIDALLKNSYDLIFMDCQMPGMDGYEATRIIREREQLRNTGSGKRDAGPGHATIIALTAHAMQGDREQCLAAGMDDYLSKPFRMKELSEIVDRWLSKKPVMRQALETGKDGSDSGPAFPPPIVQGSLDNIRVLQKDGPENILFKVIKTYLKNTPAALERLREAITAGDTVTLYETAHNLKSTSAMLGALKLSDLFEELELKGRMNATENAEKILSMLYGEFDSVCSALRKELEKGV